jgi:protein MAK11
VKELRLVTLAETTLAITASTDGFIRFFDLSELRPASTEVQHIDSISEYDTRGSRLVCLAAVAVPVSTPVANGAGPSSEDELEADEEQDESATSSDSGSSVGLDANGADEEDEFTGFGED